GRLRSLTRSRPFAGASAPMPDRGRSPRLRRTPREPEPEREAERARAPRGVVAPAGFEPAISCVKGRRLGPLDDGAHARAETGVYRVASGAAHEAAERRVLADDRAAALGAHAHDRDLDLQQV